MKAMGDSGMISALSTMSMVDSNCLLLVNAANEFIRGAAHNSFVMFTGLDCWFGTFDYSFGSKELQEKFADRMITAEWTGTMCLTEPQAGSSLSDVVTTASPQADGTYKIKGQKVFISAGDHDIADNIIHLFWRESKAPVGYQRYFFVCSTEV